MDGQELWLGANFLVPIRGKHLGRLSLSIPGRPHPKQRPRATGGKRVYNPKKNIQAEGDIVKMFLHKYGNTEWYSRLPFQGPVLLTTYFLYNRPMTQGAWWEGRDMVGKPDVDNPLKTVMDALNGTVWEDDSQVVGAHVEKFYWPQPPRTLILVDMYEPTLKGF